MDVSPAVLTAQRRIHRIRLCRLVVLEGIVETRRTCNVVNLEQRMAVFVEFVLWFWKYMNVSTDGL
jgi:hypothetical protein